MERLNEQHDDEYPDDRNTIEQSHGSSSQQHDEHNYSLPVRPTARLHKRTGKPLTRKRSRHESEWKCNKRKRLRQSGASYITVSGTLSAAKVVKTCKRDHHSCRYKCAENFSAAEQHRINEEHWSLTDDEKRQFYACTTFSGKKKRTRRAEDINRKKISYTYKFWKGERMIRVCKDFYLATLCIDAKRIINTHKTMNKTTGTPPAYQRGKHVKKSCEQYRNSIRRHIESIPRVESHYCRHDSNKEYVSGKLNLQMLYEEYTKQIGRAHV